MRFKPHPPALPDCFNVCAVAPPLSPFVDISVNPTIQAVLISRESRGKKLRLSPSVLTTWDEWIA